MAILRPWIGKSSDRSCRSLLLQRSRRAFLASTQRKRMFPRYVIFFLQLFHFLHCTQKYAGIQFNPDIIDIRVFCAIASKNFPFSHSDLNVDRILVLKDLLSEFSTVSFRLFDHISAVCKGFLCAPVYF